MQIVRNKIALDKRYITTPLDSETLTKLMTQNNAGVMHRIYLIKNDIQPIIQGFKEGRA